MFLIAFCAPAMASWKRAGWRGCRLNVVDSLPADDIDRTWDAEAGTMNDTRKKESKTQ
jgi:hypothetical protein